MRYGIKYGGTIYVGEPEAVVRRVKADCGEEYICGGYPVPGGWYRLLETVNEEVLHSLRLDYHIEEVV